MGGFGNDSEQKFKMSLRPFFETVQKGLISRRFAVLLLLFAFAAIAIALEKPVGAIEGSIAVSQPGFGLSTFDMKRLDVKGKKVYAIAVGPRDSLNPIERGAWVQPDGKFSIDRLPVGEYTLRFRAPGYATQTRAGLFIDEGKTTRLHQTVVMQALEPSVSIASNSRVFTTKEAPAFWLNSNGATSAQVEIYRTDILDWLSQPPKPGNLEFGGNLSLYKPGYDPGSKQELALLSQITQQSPVHTLTRRLEMDSDDWAHTNFKLNAPLPPGDYLVLAKVRNEAFQEKQVNDKATKKAAWNLMWFNVSDVGLIIKQSPQKAVVRAIDLNTLKPFKNVSVQLWDRARQLTPLGSAKTNADGFVEIALPEAMQRQSSLNLLAYAEKGSQHAYGGIQYWPSESNRYLTYFYTERPIYRLGQSVYFKGLVRYRDGDGLHNGATNLPVEVTVNDPDGNRISQLTAMTGSLGGFDGVTEIPAEGKTGAYEIMLRYPDGSQDYNNVEVAQYRKPEYQVDVTPLNNSDQLLIAGDTVKARIRATYYFGAPVANAVVKYSIYAKPDWNRRYSLMPRPAYYGFYDAWDSEGGDDGAYAGDYIGEGLAQTDINGEVVVSFQTKAAAGHPKSPYDWEVGDKQYKIQAEVTDLSRMSVIGSRSLPISAGRFAVFLESDKAVYKAGEPVDATVSLRDYQGRPVVGQTVTLSLSRWVWDEVNSLYRGEETRHRAEVITDATGRAKIRWALKNALPSDSYTLLAEARDGDNHLLMDSSSVWIANANSPYAVSAKNAERQPLVLKLDRPVYEPGQTARLMISAPTSGKENLSAIVSVEGRKLHSYQSVPLSATAQLVEIPILDEYAPNAYVAVSLVSKNKQYYHDEVMLKVSPESHFMRLTVTTDKEKYHPGDNVNYTVQATDSLGKPLPDAEVSLGIVDESIYALRPEAATPIQRFFYHQIYNNVMTLNSFPEEYSAGPDKIEPSVRKDFRDMAGWFPNLLTNAKGIAKASITLPDNLTTWRATARAITADTQVGEDTQQIIASQDIMLRLALPRFYTQGDKGRLAAIIHNDTDRPQTVNVSLRLDDHIQIQDVKRHALRRQVVVSKEKPMRVEWPIQADKPGEMLIAATAVTKQADNTSEKNSGDAIEQRLRILPLGVERTLSNSLSLSAPQEKGTLPLLRPQGQPDWETVRYSYTAAASVIGPVLGNLDALVDYPYGCTEQTMSRLLPGALVLQLKQKLGVPVSETLLQKTQAVGYKSLLILNQHQNTDGGWGWWAGSQSDLFISAYVLMGNVWLREAGQDLPNEQVRQGVIWLSDASKRLHQQLIDPKLNATRVQILEKQVDLAFAASVLSAYDQNVSPVIFNSAKTNLTQLPPEALSYWLIASVRQNKPQEAELFYRQLMALARRNLENASATKLIDWEHTAALLKKLGIKEQYTYRYSDAETTALALEAMLSYIKLKNDTAVQISQDIEAVKNYLLLQRGKDGWGSTKATAMVLHALLNDAMQSADRNPNTDDTATIVLSLAQKMIPEENQKAKTQDNLTAILSKLSTETILFNSKNRYQAERLLWEKTLREAAAMTANGIHRELAHFTGGFIDVQKQGGGQFYLNQRLTYTQLLKPGETVELPAYPNGLKVERTFLRLKPKLVDSIGTVRFITEPLNANIFSDGALNSGESVLMQVRIQSPVALPYVMLNVPLPSGAEVISEDPRLNLLNSEGEGEPQTGWDFMNWWWTHQDILDDRIVFFVDALPAGESRFQAIVRVEMPGEFLINPAQLSAMYSPNIQAYSNLGQLSVRDAQSAQ